MAAFFRLFFLSLSLPLALCRNDPPESTGTTTILDVTAALKKATQALAFDPHRAHQLLLDQQKTTTLSSSDSTATVSFQLYSRDFLPLPNFTFPHKDYESLSLARLHRDSVWARSIAARVALAIGGSNSKPERIQGKIVSGNSQGSGEYFARVGIGRPAKHQFVVLDTGSDISWVQCQPCTDCYKQADPIYDPMGSDTYTAIGDALPITDIPIGCGFDNKGIFVAAGGLLTLGTGRLSFPSHLPSRSFTYCLIDRDTQAHVAWIESYMAKWRSHIIF